MGNKYAKLVLICVMSAGVCGAQQVTLKELARISHAE